MTPLPTLRTWDALARALPALIAVLTLITPACRGRRGPGDAGPTTHDAGSTTRQEVRRVARGARAPTPEPVGSKASPPPRAGEATATVEERRERARRALLAGKIDEGEAILRKLWEEAPGEDRSRDLALLVATEARQGDLDACLADIEIGERAGLSTAAMADLAAAAGTNLPEPARTAVQLVQKAPPATSAAHAALLARLYERAREVRAAVPLWELAARQAPSEPTYQRELARLYAITGNPRGLENALRSLVRLSPRELAPRLDLVRIVARDGRLDEAVRLAHPPSALLPGVDGELFAADVLRRAGLTRQALERYHAVLEAAPERCEARLGQALSLATLTPGTKGTQALLALVETPVGGEPCRVVEALRALARRPEWPQTRRRLRRLLRSGGGADPEALRVFLEREARARTKEERRKRPGPRQRGARRARTKGAPLER